MSVDPGVPEPVVSGGEAATSRPAFWVGLAVGWSIIAYGVWGIFENPATTQPQKLGVWVIGTLVLHDAVIAPIVTLVGFAMAAMLPRVARGPVRAGAALSGLVVLFAYPLIRPFGRRPGNTSTLPLNYAHSVWVVLGLIWGTAVFVIVVRMVRRSRLGRRQVPVAT